MKNNKKQKVEIGTVSARVKQSTRDRFDELSDEFGCTKSAVFEYLISLESSRLEKGIFLAEQKLKQWLYLGYNKKITVHGLRYADYGFNENDKGELKPKTINQGTAKKIYELYEAEIDEHNSNIND